MKVVILYKPNAEFASAVESFAHDYQSRHAGCRLEMVNIDRREGIALASLYDIMQFPTIMVLANDGTQLHMWQGSQLPLMDEVAAYAQVV